MKVLILAAGYGTRLARDLQQTGRFPELLGVPKPLLPIAGKPLISHWMQDIRSCTELRDCDVYVVVSHLTHSNLRYLFCQVNSTNYAQFEQWSREWSRVQLVCDGTTHNDNRLGAVKCIELAVAHFNICDHLIVVGGYVTHLRKN